MAVGYVILVSKENLGRVTPLLVISRYNLFLIHCNTTKPRLHNAICPMDSFVFTPGHCINF